MKFSLEIGRKLKTINIGLNNKEIIMDEKTNYQYALEVLSTLHAEVMNGGFYYWWMNGLADQDIYILKRIVAAAREVPTMKELEEILYIYTSKEKILDQEQQDEYITCPECNGTGEYLFGYNEDIEDADEIESCYECNGDGEIYNDEYKDIEEIFEDALDEVDNMYDELYESVPSGGIPVEFLKAAEAYNKYEQTNSEVSPYKAPDGFKPYCVIVGKDGNIFNLMGIAAKALQDVGRDDLAQEMTKKIREGAKSYSQALSIICEYVDAH